MTRPGEDEEKPAHKNHAPCAHFCQYRKYKDACSTSHPHTHKQTPPTAPDSTHTQTSAHTARNVQTTNVKRSLVDDFLNAPLHPLKMTDRSFSKPRIHPLHSVYQNRLLMSAFVVSAGTSSALSFHARCLFPLPMRVGVFCLIGRASSASPSSFSSSPTKSPSPNLW